MSKPKIYKNPVMVKLDDELLAMLETWRSAQRYPPGKGEVMRDALRAFLSEKVRYPPSRAERV